MLQHSPLPDRVPTIVPTARYIIFPVFLWVVRKKMDAARSHNLQDLCERCRSINLSRVFSSPHEIKEPYSILVTMLVTITDLWKMSTCPLCRFFAAMSVPRPDDPNRLPRCGKLANGREVYAARRHGQAGENGARATIFQLRAFSCLRSYWGFS